MSAPSRFRWLKGHGTQNDFILLPDHDGTVHRDLTPSFVAALCHRREGLGADGVLRVVRCDALDDPHAAAALDAGATWFMDHRNADGSLSEMCGNGVRVFALHLVQEGLADAGAPLPVGTRDGVKTVRYGDDGRLGVNMGVPRLLGGTFVDVDGRRHPARHVDTGNPHAVAFVDDLSGPFSAPGYDRATYPGGVNVELVVRRGPGHLSMRVHERGSGETRSCGTGAVAATAAATDVDGPERLSTYRVDVPGGSLGVTWDGTGEAVLTGPARIVADGELTWLGQDSPCKHR